ncbi:response regulator transcription factor [Amycolatopsis rubida]|uniref:Response regulator transcription factor n=1 Tax=Amycolatopsis rubida TaxID=112413 RepID=A0ABX0C5C7_9PSEU|nr:MULTISPECIES: LuxR C-terminal-related transcriptional regulator [Amycolatopsis]MYW97974.1 hypothetical protein [Amycolatopsis rubida]NEC62959.1 response regulator transcription factor [Amycolatopsis rubida]OAP22627.1 Transcriptional regulatory protein UhpA [Amycolatopsis sp. M39]
MTPLEIIESRPVFLLGLTSVLASAGFEVTATRSMRKRNTKASVDLFIIDQETASNDVRLTQRCVGKTPVLLLDHAARASPLPNLAELSVRGMLSALSEPAEIVTAVHKISSGGCYWANAHVAGCPGRHNVAALSPRERQVLEHISMGDTHAQIASALGISVHTVNTYVKRARSKFRLGNKADLTRATILGHVEADLGEPSRHARGPADVPEPPARDAGRQDKRQLPVGVASCWQI